MDNGQQAVPDSKERLDKLIVDRGLAPSRERAQALILAGKVRALASGRYNVSFGDIRRFAKPALRHRLILNFEGEAEGFTTDQLIAQILEAVPTAPTA